MNTKEQVLSFFEKCDELKNCKFIMATTKIKDILKCIVNCPDIYRLFEDVTKDFNYPYAKSKCLITVNDGAYKRSYCVMPQTVAQRLAFAFCLMVEFDSETLDFNEFLSRYFPEDGSYFASYHAFCDTIIKSMRDAVAEVFKEELGELSQGSLEENSASAAKAGFISAINLAISEEKQFISTNTAIPDAEKEGGLIILTQLLEAVKNCNAQLINALLCGYNFFILYNKCVSGGIAALIREITEFEQLI